MPVRNGVFEFPAIAMVDSCQSCVVVVITLSFFYIRLMGLLQFLLHVLLLHPSNKEDKFSFFLSKMVLN